MNFTRRERQVFVLLYARSPRPLPSSLIVKRTIGEPASKNYVHALIARLRKKLDPDFKLELEAQARDAGGQFTRSPGYRLIRLPMQN